MRGRPNDGVQQIEIMMDAATVEAIVSSEHAAENRGGAPYETDGGVRLAGGRVGEVGRTEDFDQRSLMLPVDGSTLPPPYSSDFGDS